MELKEVKQQYCPMENTDYEGYCLKEVLEITTKKSPCEYYQQCDELKKELDNLTAE